MAKTTRVTRASEFTGETCLETEADVDTYIAARKAELMTTINAGQMGRVHAQLAARPTVGDLGAFIIATCFPRLDDPLPVTNWQTVPVLRHQTKTGVA